jgi:hypothetical protein
VKDDENLRIFYLIVPNKLVSTLTLFILFYQDKTSTTITHGIAAGAVPWALLVVLVC